MLDQSTSAGEDGRQQDWGDAGLRCLFESGGFDAGEEVGCGISVWGYAVGKCGALDAVACFDIDGASDALDKFYGRWLHVSNG